MKTVAVLSRKGGTGKTTVALNVALAAYLRGLRTMVADVDPQHCSHTVMQVRRESGPSVMPTSGGKLFATRAAAQGHFELLLVDTPGGLDTHVLQAVQIADFCVVVTRPNYLDLAGAVASANTLRQLAKPALIVLNQVPPPRQGIEAPIVRKAREALKFTNYPVATTALSARAGFSTALAHGMTVEEFEPKSPAATEMAALWAEVADGLWQHGHSRAKV